MKIYVVVTGENAITVSLNGEAPVAKTEKPTLTALGNGKIRFECDDIDEEVETYRNIFINAVPLKGSWIAEEDYLSVTLFEAIMNKTFSGSSPGGSSYLVYDTVGSFPAEGETEKIYEAFDTGYEYSWDGVKYVAGINTLVQDLDGDEKFFIQRSNGCIIQGKDGFDNGQPSPYRNMLCGFDLSKGDPNKAGYYIYATKDQDFLKMASIDVSVGILDADPHNVDACQLTLYSIDADTEQHLKLRADRSVTNISLQRNGATCVLNFTDDGILTVNKDVEITDTTKGVILKSPDGTRYRLKVANGGALSAEAV